MPGTHEPYPPEFRRQMVELVRSGRTPAELAREFEPSEGAIRNWVKRADLNEGRRSDGLTSDERDELRRLKREVRQLRTEREILKKSRGLVRPGEQRAPSLVLPAQWRRRQGLSPRSRAPKGPA